MPSDKASLPGATERSATARGIPNRVTSSKSSGHPDDDLVLKRLSESAIVAKEDVETLAQWFSAERNADEKLVEFLVRNGVLARSAARSVELLCRGILNLPDVGALLPEDGRRKIAEHRGRHTSPGSSEVGVLDAFAAPEHATEGGREPADPLVGRKLGQYELIGRLGRGAKGIVYEAEDTLLGRRLAVKVLDPALVNSGSTAARRFLIEARAASRLDHPNVVGVHSIGKEAGLVYYSMPLVRGRSAQEAIDRDGRFPVEEATRIASAAARGLGAAHAAGIVHRDIKPGNIMLGADGEVRVTDFGMAKVADDAIASMTEPGRWMGTPHYMSPEQGRGDPVDHRADIYSLGACYFALLTGRPPFRGADPLAVLHSQIHDAPPDVRTLVHDLPPECGRVIARAMSKDPADRFADAEEFAQALANVPASVDDARSAEPVPTARPDTIDTRIEPQSSPSDSSSLPGPGDLLGRNMLIERVGRGGSSVVFRALHQSLNVSVAVKVLTLRRDADRARVFELFRSEARLLARLNHPNIVRILDFEDRGRFPYLVLEFVDGLTLGELIAQSGRLQPQRAVALAVKTAGALAYALENGVIHRDVKPGNVLLTRDMTVKLTDLGLAMVMHAAARTADASITVGTPAYMSPEQHEGRPDVDHRADIYSLGATLHHAVTGNPPPHFSLGLTLQAPSDVPAPLMRVIGKALSPRPQDRHQSYDEFLAELQPLAESVAQDPAPPSSEGSRRRWSLWSMLGGRQ